MANEQRTSESRERARGSRTAAGPEGRRKNVAHPLLAVLLALAAMVVLLEIGLRIAGWTRTFEIVERIEEGAPRRLGVRTLHANAVIRHVTKEFNVTYRSNSLGYYDDEWQRGGAEGRLRIAFFGDSFTMGHGVGSAHAFPRLIESKLRKRLNRDIETMNFGVWGSGTLDEREYIEDALTIGADLIVICFYINDVFDNVRYMNERRREEQFEPGDELAVEHVSGRQKSLIRLKELLNRRSRAFAFFSERTKNLRDALGLVTYPLEGVFTGQSNRLLEETAGYLNEIARTLADRGIPLIVVYLPAKVQVDVKHAPDDFELDLPQRILAGTLKGCTFIDLTEDFRGVDVDEIWFREGHYNERGHEIVATWLSERLPIAK